MYPLDVHAVSCGREMPAETADTRTLGECCGRRNAKASCQPSTVYARYGYRLLTRQCEVQ